MPIPDYQSLMLPVLRLVGDRQEHPVARLRTQIAAQLNLTESELSQRLASDTQTVFANRVAWAVQYLKSAAVTRAVRRGVYQITDRGFSLLKAHPSEITVKTLRQFSGICGVRGKRNANPSQRPLGRAVERESRLRLRSRWRRSYQVLRDALGHGSLWRPSETAHPPLSSRSSWTYWWRWVTAARLRMPGEVVGKSGDGGIDGIIKQDKLGLDCPLRSGKALGQSVGSPGRS